MTEVRGVTLVFNCGDAASALQQVKQFAQGAGGDPLADVSTEALLAALRDRMFKMDPPQVVKVVPFDETIGLGAALSEKPAATPDERPVAEPEKPKAARRPREQPKAVAADTQQAGQATATEAPAGGDDKAISREALTDALNACAAKHGQAETRKIMKDAGGAERLMDVKPDAYPKLLNALKEKAAA